MKFLIVFLAVIAFATIAKAQDTPAENEDNSEEISEPFIPVQFPFPFSFNRPLFPFSLFNPRPVLYDIFQNYYLGGRPQAEDSTITTTTAVYPDYYDDNIAI